MLEHVPVHDIPFDAAEPANPTAEIRRLESRLHRGWEVISDAELRGDQTDDYMAHFLKLLRQYEALCDSQRAA